MLSPWTPWRYSSRHSKWNRGKTFQYPLEGCTDFEAIWTLRQTEKSLVPARNRTLGGQAIKHPYHFNGNFSVVVLCKLHLLGGRFPSGFPPISHLCAFLKQTGRADETSARMMWRSLGRKQACVCFHYTYRRSPQLILHCIQWRDRGE